jgi:2-polyprenyl-3-methyl-5-hydroxy-6-metoxy-1,4-benzoquinol methylase
MNCIICENKLNKYSENSNLEMPVYYCKNCNYYVTGESEIEIEQKLNKLYSGAYWDERKAKISIDSNYTDNDSLGKLRNWTSQFSYCKKFFQNKKSILEIGVGGGQAVYQFDQKGYTITGIEPDSRNVELINKKLKNGKVIHSFIENIDMDESFDIIWMSHVLEHLVKPDIFLKKINKNLKKDGIFFIEVPSCEHKPTLQASIFENPHVHHFSKKSLLKLVENDYDVISCDCFRPATKIEGALQKILKMYSFYPRIKTSCKNGRDLRIIFRKKIK